MKLFLIFYLFTTTSSVCFGQKVDSLFQTQDFTQENIFTNNIEGPCFDSRGNLYVVNYLKEGTIGKIDTSGTVSLFLTLPTGSTANSIKFDAKGRMYLADYTAHNVLRVNMDTKKVEVYAHDKFNQPNDMCIAKTGQFFVTDPNWKDSTGKLWRINLGGKAVLLASMMGTTNGIELSPDEKTLYVNESVQRKVWAFTVNKDGGISTKRLFAEFSDFGLDGMKCDKQGNLYITRHGKGTIAVLSPAGKLIREVVLKGKACSNLVFGGANGTLVFVTLQDRRCLEMFKNDIPGKSF